MSGESHRSTIWREFKKSKVGLGALGVLLLFFLVGLYAPLFASSKPLLVFWRGDFYFPLFRYLFYSNFYTKPIDLFFNALMFIFPVALMGGWILRGRRRVCFLLICALSQLLFFTWALLWGVKDPARNTSSQQASRDANRVHASSENVVLTPLPHYLNWNQELGSLSTYSQLNTLLTYKNTSQQHNRLASVLDSYLKKTGRDMPTNWHVWNRNQKLKMDQLRTTIEKEKLNYLAALDKFPVLVHEYLPLSHNYIIEKYLLEHAESTTQKKEAQERMTLLLKETAQQRSSLEYMRHTIHNYQKSINDLAALEEKIQWLHNESEHVHIVIPAFLRSFHWEEDAGGAQEANRELPWWELTRINRKDLLSSLLFGIRVSMVVGFSAVSLALLIGIPLGSIAGYFAGKTDLIICRLIEMWEAMPTFFMLLLVVAITQSKSLFLVIAVLGIFGWTGMGRFMRGEVLKQRKLSYVLACRSLGYSHKRIMFSHIFPNAIPPILTLLPFSLMAAIISEAGLSFLGLGEEGATSWGVLMDEGRSVFPGESYLLWPPAILLTLLLISIAIVGDRLRDAIDPKMRA